jgi:hypothetical protein
MTSPSHYVGGGGESGGGGSSGSWDEPESQQSARVTRVVISRSDNIIVFETLSTAYVYQLETCQVPVGSYHTTVTVTGNNVDWDFGEQAQGEVFRFSYLVRPGQDNPATLFESGQAVQIDVVPSWSVRQRSEQPECLLSIGQRVVIPGDSIQRDLFPTWEREVTLWEHEIPLGEFGWVDVSLVANGRAAGNLSAGYGPGVLRDICLVRRLDASRLAGTATFELPADFVAEIQLTGTARLSADYLSIIPVTAIEGQIQATGRAQANNSLSARVDVIYDHRDNRWRFATEATIAGQASLQFLLDTRVAVEILSRTLWSERWRLADYEVGFDWSGGFSIGRDLAPRLQVGRIGRSGSPAAMSTSAQANAVPAAGVASDPPISAIMTQLMSFGSGQQTAAPARRGFSRGDALPFQWYKPIVFYPAEMELPSATPPITVRRDDGPIMVGYTERGRTINERIGVNRRNWPWVGKAFQYIPEDRSDTEKDRFRRLVARLGYTETGVQIDHVHDIQFGGRDHFSNLWPMSEDANMSAGPRHQQQLDRYRQTLGNINGRWFEIVRIGL